MFQIYVFEHCAKEKNTTGSTVPFPLEKEMEELWPLPLLSQGGVMMDPDPEQL